MNLRLHKNARTTPRTRAEIQASTEPVAKLAVRYGVAEDTVRRWKGRTTTEDASSRPRELHATLSAAQEEIVVELRRTLRLPIDDLLVVVREFLCPRLSRSALDRCLRRHGVASLRAMEPPPERATPKKFKAYAPGYVHVDVKYLPRMADERARRYLYVAIDRATRWVYLEVLPSKSSAQARGFLKRLVEAAPFRIETVLSDNGSEFSDRFCRGRERTPTGRHAFDQECEAQGIEHRLIPPWHPQTNGMVERFNGRVTDELARTRFGSATELENAMYAYRAVYNNHIPQRALGHRTPRQALLDWFAKHPERFRFDPANLPGPDR